MGGFVDATHDLVTVHYYLVYGRLALFVQVPVEDSAARLGLAAQVQDAAVNAAGEGRLPEVGSLHVVDTPFGLHHWEWTPAVDGNGDGLEGALAWLERR